MRVSVVSIFLAGGMLALGACATTETRTMTLAERTAQCELRRAEITPTGRQTGDARQDYECRSAHGLGRHDARDRNTGNTSTGRDTAIDRALRTGN